MQLLEMAFACAYHSDTGMVCERLFQMPNDDIRKIFVDSSNLELNKDYINKLQQVDKIFGVYSGPRLRSHLQLRKIDWMQNFLPKMPASGFVKNYLNMCLWSTNLIAWADPQQWCHAYEVIKYICTKVLKPLLP